MNGFRPVLRVFAVSILFATAVFVNPLKASAQNGAPVRDVENPARTAVQQQCFINYDGGAVGTGCAIYTVPAGYRLVIEHASARCFTFDGSQIDELRISASLNNGSHTTHLVAVSQVTGSTVATYAASQSMRMYADSSAGATVHGSFTRTMPNVFTNCQFSIAGYLISFP